MRPITLLCLNDQIVYQAIANYLADRFFRILQPNYGLKTFGAQYAGATSPFFYRSWKRSYRAFNSAVRASYLKGYDVLADFDLVSFFDLIDHKVLRKRLEVRIRRREVLELLFLCLEKWTSGNPVYVRGHGIPQGPEPSAFLAEILLSNFDNEIYPGGVAYMRYVDDIKLMANDFSPLRRALLRLDLRAKRLGLVPQAQKIGVRRITDINAELKTVPSSIAGASGPPRYRLLSKTSAARLARLLRNSVKRKAGELTVLNETHFKFALYRLPPTRRILRLVRPLLRSRPDLSPVIAGFLAAYPSRSQAAKILYEALSFDPVFDASAGDYVLALDRCASSPGPKRYRMAIEGLFAKSEEKSPLLDFPAKPYCLKRLSRRRATSAVLAEKDPFVAGLLIGAFLLSPSHPGLTFRDFQRPLSRFARSQNNEDLSRLCTYLMLIGLKRIPGRRTPTSSIMLSHLGYTVRPVTSSFLDSFYKDIFLIRARVNWERALGKRAHSELQRRAIAIRGQWSGNPSLLITMIDSFNDLLIQRLSRSHTSLKHPFHAAIRNKAKDKIPDFGLWVNNNALKVVLPKSQPVFSACHKLRVRADIAHATDKKTGRFTKPVSYFELSKITKALKGAYAELSTELRKL